MQSFVGGEDEDEDGQEGEGKRAWWPGWPGASHASTRDFAAWIADGETGHFPIVFWSSLESTKGCGEVSLERGFGLRFGVGSLLCQY